MKFGIQTFLTDRSMPPARLARYRDARVRLDVHGRAHAHPFGTQDAGAVRRATARAVLALSRPFRCAHRSRDRAPRLRVPVSRSTLVAQRDAIVTAKEVATIDLLTGGRFTFGIGFGWNRDEIEDHGVAYKRRRDVARRRCSRCQPLGTRGSVLRRRIRSPVSHLLLRRFPSEREGQLARRHAAHVSARTLGEIAEAIGLRDHRIAYRGAPKATPASWPTCWRRCWGPSSSMPASRRPPPRRAPVGRAAGQPASRAAAAEDAVAGMGAGPRARAAVLQADRPRRQRARAGVPGRGQGRQPAAGAGRGLTKRDAESAAATLMLEQLSKT